MSDTNPFMWIAPSIVALVLGGGAIASCLSGCGSAPISSDGGSNDAEPVRICSTSADCPMGYHCQRTAVLPVNTCAPTDAAIEADASIEADAGERYWLITTPMTWTMAMTACAADGGRLVTILGDEEQGAAWSTAMPAVMPVWIGATNGAGGPWGWSTGEPWTSRWAPTQPDNAGGAEHCAVLWPSFGGAWADVPCDSLYPAVCER